MFFTEENENSQNNNNDDIFNITVSCIHNRKFQAGRLHMCAEIHICVFIYRYTDIHIHICTGLYIYTHRYIQGVGFFFVLAAVLLHDSK